MQNQKPAAPRHRTSSSQADPPAAPTQEAGCCGPDGCGEVTRRDFVTRSGLYAASLAVLGGQAAGAVQARASAMATGALVLGQDGVHPSHGVPVDKGLEPGWMEKLLVVGESRIYSGDELETIGMPIGGIGAGQLYLGGDGRLLHWDVFNEHFNSAAINTYPTGRQKLTQPVAHGFVLQINDNGQNTKRALDANRQMTRDGKGFEDVRFIGEYPIGRVGYRDESLPIETTLTAFSPFIPLNAQDSGLPATVMRFTLKNTSDREVSASIEGRLENAVCRQGTPPPGKWRNEFSHGDGLSFVQMSFEPHEPAPEQEEPREAIVFADFEQEDYGDWKPQGEALGAGPAKGTIPPQQQVSGYEGDRLVNTFHGGDSPTAKLTSPSFKIDRKYINFLIGGGSDPERFGIRLIVDGETVRRESARNDEKLSWASWWVEDLAGKEARLEIYDAGGGPWGHINIDQIEFADEPRQKAGEARERHDFGTMGLGIVAEENVSEPDDVTAKAPGEESTVGQSVMLAPGESRDMTFVLTWHFPNLDPGGRFYASRFDTALEVARYLAKELPRLAEETQRWHDAYYDSTLPHWLLDRLHMPISILASSTSQWWKNGRFWAWEGVGCCAGTCTHVWNYEQAMARLFPQLEQSVRQMQDFDADAGFQPVTGLVGFRGESHMAYAADGQAGTVLKAYREHLVSPDREFLKKNWPQISKTMQFLIVQDVNVDGIIENEQHNTYDIEFYGANTFVGALYLAALRASEVMADAMGDEALANTCRRAFEAGSKFSMEHLFNGEYFTQRANLNQHPLHQYGDGCLSDQLFGQNWAHQLSLGHLYPAQAVRKGVESVWRYNWAPDVAPQNQLHGPERVFAEPGEPGLFICTWPKSEHPGNRGVRYRDEVWTGIEYEVAAGLVYEGLLNEGLAVVKAVDERYDASKRNPWNEIECGDHYARAMASWGMLLALSGFEYDGPAGRLGFAPRTTPEDFRCAFTAAEGWGTLEQTREAGVQRNAVIVRWGRLRLTSLDLQAGAEGEVKVSVGERAVEGVTAEIGEGGRLRVSFEAPVVLEEGQSLRVEVG